MTAIWRYACIDLEGRRTPGDVEADLIDLSVQTEFLWTADALKGWRGRAFGPRRMFLGKYGFVQILWDSETMQKLGRQAIDEQRAIIESVRGVARTHCDRDGLPQQVRPGEIAFLRRLLATTAKDTDKPEAKRKPGMLYDAGTPLRITEGAFAGYPAAYLYPLPNGLQKVEIEIFGRKTDTEIAASEIEEDKSAELATA